LQDTRPDVSVVPETHASLHDLKAKIAEDNDEQDLFFAETQIVEPPVEQDLEGSTVTEPMQMQSVLGRRDNDLKGWEENERQPAAEMPQEVSLSRGAIDDNRLRRLSQLVETVNRSIWVDIVVWVMAVLIGVGVGFVFLKLCFPDLVGRPSHEISQDHSPDRGSTSVYVAE